MAEAKLYGQNKGGMSINGIIKDYYAYAGENISAGDLVEYVTGVARRTVYGTSVDTDLSQNATYSGQYISAVTLDENRVFIAYGSGSTNTYLNAIIVTIDGATITKGESVRISSDDYAGRTISTVKMTNGNVFVAHSYNVSKLYGVVCKINDTTITAGEDTLIVNDNYAYSEMSAEILDDNRIFIAHSRDINYYLYGIIVTISDTTISKGSDYRIASTVHSGDVINTTVLA